MYIHLEPNSPQLEFESFVNNFKIFSFEILNDFSMFKDFVLKQSPQINHFDYEFHMHKIFRFHYKFLFIQFLMHAYLFVNFLSYINLVTECFC